MVSTSQKFLKILIANGNKPVRERVKKLLIQGDPDASFEFHEADYGQEVSEMLRDHRYDCIFLNYDLPDSNGLILLHRLQDTSENMRASPVVMIIREHDKDIAASMLRMGAMDYVIKEHLTPASITSVLHKAHDLHHAHREAMVVPYVPSAADTAARRSYRKQRLEARLRHVFHIRAA